MQTDFHEIFYLYTIQTRRDTPVKLNGQSQDIRWSFFTKSLKNNYSDEDSRRWTRKRKNIGNLAVKWMKEMRRTTKNSQQAWKRTIDLLKSCHPLRKFQILKELFSPSIMPKDVYISYHQATIKRNLAAH